MVTVALRTATTAAFVLRYIILRHIASRGFISDCGHLLMAGTVQSLPPVCNVVRVPTTAYHPQPNRPMELFNYTLSNIISMYLCNGHSFTGVRLWMMKADRGYWMKPSGVLKSAANWPMLVRRKSTLQQNSIVVNITGRWTTHLATSHFLIFHVVKWDV